MLKGEVVCLIEIHMTSPGAFYVIKPGFYPGNQWEPQPVGSPIHRKTHQGGWHSPPN